MAFETKATSRPLKLRDGRSLSKSPGLPAASWLTRSVFPEMRSCTNTCRKPFAPGARFSEVETKATMRPSGEMSGNWLAASPGAPALSTLARSVVPVSRSCT